MNTIPVPRRFLASLVVSAALFVPLAVFGGSALARSASSQYEYSSPSQYQYRVQICHRTHSKKHPWRTITVSNRALKGHLKHGDHVGACTGTEPVAPKHHGKGNAQGQNASNGNHGKK